MAGFHFAAVIASLLVLQLQQDPFPLADAFLVREEIVFSPCPVGSLLRSSASPSCRVLIVREELGLIPLAPPRWLLFPIAAAMPVVQQRTYSSSGGCWRDVPSWLVRVAPEGFCTKLSVRREEPGRFGGGCVR